MKFFNRTILILFLLSAVVLTAPVLKGVSASSCGDSMDDVRSAISGASTEDPFRTWYPAESVPLEAAALDPNETADWLARILRENPTVVGELREVQISSSISDSVLSAFGSRHPDLNSHLIFIRAASREQRVGDNPFRISIPVVDPESEVSGEAVTSLNISAQWLEDWLVTNLPAGRVVYLSSDQQLRAAVQRFKASRSETASRTVFVVSQ